MGVGPLELVVSYSLHPAQRMLPSRLGFPSPPPCGPALGRGRAAWRQPVAREWGQLMAWEEGEAQTPPATAIPSQSLWKAGGDKHISERRTHHEKKRSIKASPNAFATQKRKSRLSRLP